MEIGDRGEIKKNSSKLYLEKNQERYTKHSFRFDQVEGDVFSGTRVDVHIPKEAKNQKFYEEVMRKSLQTNKDFFHTLPVKMDIILLETVEDWNFFITDTQFKKTKGDRFAGALMGGNSIIVYTPEALQSLTNIMDNIDNNPATSIEAKFQQLLTHETAHLFTSNICGSYLQRLQRWLFEGIALYAVQHSGIEITPPLAQELRELIASQGQNGEDFSPPSDGFLMKTKFAGKEKKAPIGYAYGYWFMQYLFKNRPPSLTKPLLIQYVKSDGDFDKAFLKTFKMSYKNAYNEFLGYLQSVSNGRTSPES